MVEEMVACLRGILSRHWERSHRCRGSVFLVGTGDGDLGKTDFFQATETLRSEAPKHWPAHELVV